MKQINMLRSRKGISLTETVIALVLISVISATAVSLVLRSVNIEKKTLIVMEAANTAENAVECFRFSENAETFLTALQKTAPYEQQEDGSFLLKSGNLIVTIQADVAANQFAYTAVNKDGEEIYSFYYPNPVHNILIDTTEYTDPNTKNNLDLVAYAQDAYNKKWGYVWGTYGEVLDEGLLSAKCAQYPEEVDQKKEFIRTHWLDGRTTDCVGLIKGYCWLDPQTKQHGYTVNGMDDLNADQLYNSVAAENKGSIDTMPEMPGLALWHEGHIGVYIGEGKVIHAYTTQSGVVCTTMEEYGEWTHWLKVPGLTYIAPAPDPSQPTEPTAPTEPTTPTETTAPTETQPTSTEGGGAS